MKRSSQRTLCVALWVLLFCIIILPFASAAKPTTVTTKATVPPILQACAHATYPVARFTCSFPDDPSAGIPGGPPYTIQCMDNSSAEANQSISSWNWDFGDGGSSIDRNPRHTYAEASMYDIRLTVTTRCGSKYSNTTTSSITTFCSVPEPAFTTNVTEGIVPLAVQVTDVSNNTPKDITRWTYWFSDTHVSHERNPAFLYSMSGTYTINQTVRKDCVQIGSSFYPPATRRIIVHPQSAIPDEGLGTNTTPATMPTLSSRTPVSGAVPVAATTPAVTAKNLPGVPGTGILSVITGPAGALVYVDNVPRGTSPATIPGLSAGSHTLRLERDGYQTMTIPVMINAGTTTAFSTTLAPVSGGIAFLPIFVLTLIVLGLAGMGIFLYRRQKEHNKD
ncbi:MAG: PKD domain-containing protein [Methanoregula sp.]|nr:PKD domain-containing protein [Methanoregula sp.]